MDAPQSFGEWLRHRRRELDLTQDALARQVGCARVTIRKLEADEMRPSKQLAGLLAEQLGVPPDERETFVRLGRGGLPIDQTKITPRHNLPINPSSFIGRERELAAVKQMLHSSRLVTLTGSGGIGKTRLALQAASELLDAYQHGVWWVELAALRDPALVVQAIAKAREVHEIPNQPLLETLIDSLRDQQLLLVLDNCEHLISACAQLVDRLLGACQNLRILATSREALDIIGETIWTVPSLSLPDRQEPFASQALSKFESIRLFADRATAVQPGFELTDHNAEAVVQICRRLSGIPLAIELAAARVKMMSVDKLAQRLDDRFDLLTGGSRTALPRHQTLRAMVDWSYELLIEPERILFRRLAAFSGGFTLDSAEAVAVGAKVSKWQAVDILGQLVNKSLVTVEASSGAAENATRYGMLETIRAYAMERLTESGEASMLRQTHAEYFLKVAEAASIQLRGPDQLKWLNRLEIEHDNLHAALDWTQTAEAGSDSSGVMALRLVSALAWFWLARGYWSEGREWLRLALALDHAATSRYFARALTASGMMAWYLGHFAMARAQLYDSVKLSREMQYTSEVAYALVCLATIIGNVGLEEVERSREMAHEGEVLFQSLGDQWGIAFACNAQGTAALVQNDLSSARILIEQSIALYRELGDRWRTGEPLRKLGDLAQQGGDYVAAQALYEESLAIARELSNKSGVAAGLSALADVAYAQGDYDSAQNLYEESLALWAKLNDKLNSSWMYYRLGKVAWRRGELHLAEALMTKAMPTVQAAGDWGGLAWLHQHLGFLAVQRGLGASKPEQHQFYQHARQHLCKAIDLARLENHPVTIAFALLGSAGLAAVTERLELAARLWGAAMELEASSSNYMSAVDRSDFNLVGSMAQDLIDVKVCAKGIEVGRHLSPDQVAEVMLNEL